MPVEIVTDPEDFRVVSRLRNGMELAVTADHDDILGIQRGVLIKLIIATIVLTASLAGVAIVTVNKIVRPIKTLTEAAEKLAKNDYHINISHSNTKEIIQLNATFQHMTEQLREREKLQQMLAYRDALTALRNTTAYKAWISEFDQKLRENTIEFGVAVFDINYLKETNDRYGHDIGNQLVVTAARIISSTFKRSPVFRIGGDEFVVILQNKDFQDYDDLIRKFRSDCEEGSLMVGSERVPVSVASGSAVYDPLLDGGYMDVFNRADDVMYNNKRKMKGCVGR